MKRYDRIFGLVSSLLCAALVLAACGAEAAQQGSSVDSPSSQGVEESVGEVKAKNDTALKAENIDLGNMDDVTVEFLTPLTTDFLFYSWGSASEITADNLIEFCAKNNLLNLPQDVEGGYAPKYMNAPANEVEKALQKNFDVKADYLRTSKWYDASTETYVLGVGGGGVGRIAISAEQKDRKIIMEVGLMAPDEEDDEGMIARKKAMPYYPHTLKGWIVFPSGTMTVELTDENIIRYISYELNESFQWN